MIKVTIKEFINRANSVHNNFYIYDKTIYKKSTEKLIITCPIHGDFEQLANNHVRGQGCPYCAGNKKDTLETFIVKANKVHNNKYDYSLVEYVSSHIKVKIRCNIHNFIFEQSPANHLSGKGCTKCSGHFMDTEYFKEKANKVHNNMFDYSNVVYTNTETKVSIKCNSCNHYFMQDPRNHLRGNGCPKCILKSQTILFQKLQKDFKDELFIWEYSPDWLGRQRIDIFIPKYNIGIEYNGEQHYKIKEFFGGEEGFYNQQERDNLKKQKCIENNCTLFEVKYDYNDNDYENLIKEIKKLITNDNTNLLNTI